MVRKVGWLTMTFAAGAIALVAMAALLLPDARSPILADHLRLVPVIVIAHVLGGVIALLTGAVQFNARLRRERRAFHRWCGRVYVTAVLLGGAGGLALAPLSQGGVVAHLGFGLLGALWLGSTLAAYTAIRAGRVTAHQEWMRRSYALTFAAVTLRLYIPLSQVAGIPFDSAYPVIAWLCWVPNLLAVEGFALSQRRLAHGLS